VVNLLAVPPGAGILPRSAGGVALTEVVVDIALSVMPFAGQHDAVAAALRDQIGVGLPLANRWVGRGEARVQWFGHGTWLVTGAVALEGLAAVTDQSDAWGVVRVAGAGVEDVLARLVPMDLRLARFDVGAAARTMLGHMSVAVARVDTQAFDVMVMRSMAATLVHDLDGAMRGVAARGSNF